jgi:hypothetical protein
MSAINPNSSQPLASSKPPEKEETSSQPRPETTETQPQSAGGPDSGPKAVQPSPGGFIGAGQQGAFSNPAGTSFQDNGSTTPGAV